MLEDKTTETRQDEPAAAPRHTGFRAKLRSLWAQLQCVHLLRRHRRYRRRRHRLDNASRKLRSSKLVLRVGAVLYALGFGAEYAAVRVGRAVKYAALWAAGGIRRFAKALAETAFPGAAQVAKDLFGPIVLFAKGTVSLLIHAHRIRKEQGFGAAFEASVHYFKNGVRRNLSLLPRMAMYALPICALALGAAVFQYVIHQPYALAVRVNGETVGYVANEDVFNTAREDVMERISYAGTDKTEWTIEPSYTLAIAHHMMDENEMAKYNEKELADTSKFLSFVLRHKPEAIGIVLDREGWADIDKLILCAQKAGKRLTRALLDTVVATSDKKRFSYSSDGRCIRAVQGHSTSQVAISFAEKTPPQFLYHGTASRFLDEIKKQGLIAGERHYVHLSADEATARKVGARHGSPVILTVKAQEMAKRGLPFWQAENGVWLTSTVAVEFLEW